MLRILSVLLVGSAARPLLATSAGESSPAIRTEASEPGPVVSLWLKELTLPRSLFVWSVLRYTEDLDAASLRRVMHDLWTSRAGGSPLAAEPIVAEALADRAPGSLVADALAFAAAGTGGGAADREAARLWAWFASSASGKLLPLPPELTGKPDHAAFLLTAAAGTEVPLSRLPSLIAVLTAGNEQPVRDALLNRILWGMVRLHGVAAVSRSLRRLPDKTLRTAAMRVLDEIRSDPPLPPAPADKPSLPPLSRELTGLLKLDASPDNSSRIPFPLLREVHKRSPADCLSLAKEFRRPQPEGHWLAWMLFMRAAEGDAAAAADVAVESGLPLVRAGEATATVWALQPEIDPDQFLTIVREMPSPAAKAEALSGFLTGIHGQKFITGQLGNPVFGYAASLPLSAGFWRAGLCKAAAAGAGEAALATADSLRADSRTGRDALREDIIRAWTLSHPDQVRAKAAQLTNPDELTPFRKALDSIRAVRPAP